MQRQIWSRDEQLLALRLYFLLPFGQLHQKNSGVIAVAKSINRTPSAVAMKACNFASLDPDLQQKGLGNVSKLDRELWNEFVENSEKVSLELEDTYQVSIKNEVENELLLLIPKGETESIRSVRVRRVQGFFRKSVMVSYDNCCALTGLNIPKLLIASHIIPWSKDEARRADPTNGIALNVLYDKLFDTGFIAFDDNLRVILSKKLTYDLRSDVGLQHAFEIEGLQLNLPSRFHPDITAIKYHRQNIFLQ